MVALRVRTAVVQLLPAVFRLGTGELHGPGGVTPIQAWVMPPPGGVDADSIGVVRQAEAVRP